ncbi:hypothetical protein Tco_0641509 [Tanacetum coccineum]
MGGSSFSTIEEFVEEHEIADEYLTNGYLTKKEQQQLLLDEEALRETLEEEEAMAEKEWEERIKQKQAHDKLLSQALSPSLGLLPVVKVTLRAFAKP